MKYKIFEQHIKNELSNTTEAVDINSLITNIHSTNKTNKRRVLFWILSSLIILSFLSIGINKILTNNSKNIIDHSIIPESNNTYFKNPNIALNSKPKQELEENNNQFIDQKEKSFQESNSNQIFNHQNLNRSNYKDSDNQINNRNLNKKESNNATILNRYEKTYKNNYSKNENHQVFVKSNNLSLPSLEMKKDLIEVSTLTNKSFEITSIDKQNFISDPIKCPSFKTKSMWYFTFVSELGLLLPIKQLNNNRASEELFNLRKENEKPLEGIQGAIYGQIGRVKNPFYFKFGLSYSRISDRLKYNYSYTQSDTTQGIISVTESENGDTLTIIRGDIITETTIERNLTQHQYFHMIDIPFGIGYNFDLGSFLLGIEVGGQFNILTISRGSIFEGVNTLTEIKDTDLFKTSLGMTYYGSFNFIKPLTSQSSVYLSARFRYFPSNFSSKTNNINQKYDLAGLHFGYMYTFY